MAKKKILLVVSSPTVSTTTGWPVGFWASELIHPYDAFSKKGYEVTVASTKGGRVQMDAMSDPRDESGYSKEDALSLQYLNDDAFLRLLEKTPKVGDLDGDEFDAIVVAGGQAPMFTFEGTKDLQELFTEFYESDKPTAALCHGTAVLRYARASNGDLLVRGKKVTGFANSEEDQADEAVGQKVMPWRIEDELTALGAKFEAADAWTPFAVVDGNLITGQQQFSGLKVAQEVVAQLEA